MSAFQSMRSVRSQLRSQRRLSRFAVPSAYASVSSASRERDAPDQEDVDVLAKMDLAKVSKIVAQPPKLEPNDFQAVLFLLDVDRKPLAHMVKRRITEQTVLLHVYNLNQDFVEANSFLTFANESVAVGGVFHVAVEVYDSEWSYGVCGVSGDPPRSETAHVYQCSVYMGNTPLSQEEFTNFLFNFIQAPRWRGAKYDLVSNNCCSFARELCLGLQVGETPNWVDRFARVLHAGREAGREALEAGASVVQEAGQFAAEKGHEAGVVVHRAVTQDMPAMVEAAKPHVNRAVEEAMVQGQVVKRVVGIQVTLAAAVVEHQATKFAEELPARAAELQEQASAASSVVYRYAEPHVQRGLRHVSTGLNDLAETLFGAPSLASSSGNSTPVSPQGSPVKSSPTSANAMQGFHLQTQLPSAGAQPAHGTSSQVQSGHQSVALQLGSQVLHGQPTVASQVSPNALQAQIRQQSWSPHLAHTASLLSAPSSLVSANQVIPASMQPAAPLSARSATPLSARAATPLSARSATPLSARPSMAVLAGQPAPRSMPHTTPGVAYPSVSGVSVPVNQAASAPYQRLQLPIAQRLSAASVAQQQSWQPATASVAQQQSWQPVPLSARGSPAGSPLQPPFPQASAHSSPMHSPAALGTPTVRRFVG